MTTIEGYIDAETIIALARYFGLPLPKIFELRSAGMITPRMIEESRHVRPLGKGQEV